MVRISHMLSLCRMEVLELLRLPRKAKVRVVAESDSPEVSSWGSAKDIR